MPKRIPTLERYLDKFHTGEIIYPAKTAQEFALDIVSAYRYLDPGIEAKQLTSVLEPFCDKCKKFSGIQYDTIWDLPTPYTCPHCGKEINVLENSIVVYKKV